MGLDRINDFNGAIIITRRVSLRAFARAFTIGFLTRNPYIYIYYTNYRGNTNGDPENLFRGDKNRWSVHRTVCNSNQMLE